MALTRKFLRDKGIEDDATIQEIIDAHMETVTPLKAYQTEVERLNAQLAEEIGKREAAETALANANKDDYKVKYEELVAQNAERETAEKKRTALDAVLAEAGLSEKGKALAKKYTNLANIQLGKDGSIANAEDIKAAVLADFGEYKEQIVTRGATVANPPAGNGSGGGWTKDKIMAIKDGAERRQKMLENMDLFGLTPSGGSNTGNNTGNTANNT